MQFIKDLGKVIGVIIGILLLLMFFGWLSGAKSGKDKTEYYLYESEIADDINERDNAPWNKDTVI